MRLIDADALANYANNQIVGITANEIMRFPTVDAEPVRHGEWIKVDDYAVMCSECGKYEKWIYPYCHCGAKMDGRRRK